MMHDHDNQSGHEQRREAWRAAREAKRAAWRAAPRRPACAPWRLEPFWRSEILGPRCREHEAAGVWTRHARHCGMGGQTLAGEVAELEGEGRRHGEDHRLAEPARHRAREARVNDDARLAAEIEKLRDIDTGTEVMELD